MKLKRTIPLLFALLVASCGVDGLVQEAEIKLEAGKTSDALELLARAIKQDPQNVDAYSERASIYSSQKNYMKAMFDYSMAAVNSESRDKSQTGILYHLAALNGDLGMINGTIALSCKDSSIDRYYEQACKNGVGEACDKKCFER